MVESVTEEDELVVESRRKFIKAAGKLAIYTPPAMMVLMNPSAEAFAKSAGGGDGSQDVGRERDRERERRKRRKKRRRRKDG
ncbi:MAG: hypothetical protein K0U72_01715 [Gammaproteobacteria bacterium]|nr:hypothetical protein [Gammaproteobacteria bacterium]